MQVDVVAQLRGQVDTGAGAVLEEGRRLVRGGLRVVLGFFFCGWVREWGGELLPETLGDRVEGIPIARLQNCKRQGTTAESGTGDREGRAYLLGVWAEWTIVCRDSPRRIQGT